MAPVLSKMSSPAAQTSGRHLALTLPTRSGPLTINQLTDDSLIILLSLLPLAQLLDTVLFTCKRWATLSPLVLPLVFRQRHSLVLHGYPSAFEILKEHFLFQTKRRIKPEAYAAYLTALFQPWANRSPTSMGVFNQRNSFPFFQPHQLERSFSLCKFLASHFRQLTHLSLLHVQFQLEPLLQLLATYRDSLQSLAIKCPTFIDPACTRLDDRKQAQAYACLWPLLDSMTALKRLALDLTVSTPNLAPFLKNLLPRLTSFTLENYIVDADEIRTLLDQLDENKLTQLNLCTIGTWVVSDGMGSSLLDFFTDRPTFGRSLTSLTLIPASGTLPLALFQTIINRCTRLRHLGFTKVKSNQFDRLLPYLAKLPHLTSLRLHSDYADLFQASPGGSRLISLHPLTSLRTLILETLINPLTFAILPAVAPNLRQLYLDNASLPLQRGQTRLSMVNQKRSYTQLVALIETLSSFAFLPKIEFPSNL